METSWYNVVDLRSSMCVGILLLAIERHEQQARAVHSTYSLHHIPRKASMSTLRMDNEVAEDDVAQGLSKIIPSTEPYP